LLLMLSHNSKLDIIYEIMDTPLAARKPYSQIQPAMVDKDAPEGKKTTKKRKKA